MDAIETPNSEWETQADVDACLDEIDVTIDQVRRWRREGLLPDVEQIPNAFHGSETRYPRGTCMQIQAARALFQKKNRVDYVGLNLWRQGFEVDQKHWRPRLLKFGRLADRILPFLVRLKSRYDRYWENETLSDKMARHPVRNIIYSRIKGRLAEGELATFIRVISELSCGTFESFEPPDNGQTRSEDLEIIIKAFDFGKSENHKVRGLGINSIEVISSAFLNVSQVVKSGSWELAANAPAREIAEARNDAINGLTIGVLLYEAFRWVYGETAFGLRFLHWFARKAPDVVIDGLMLGMLKLRRIPGAVLPSEDIAKLAWEAVQIRNILEQIDRVWYEDLRFKEVLDPNKIRAAIVDKKLQKQLIQEIQSIINVDLQ